jgi:D-alanine transaminase
MICYFNGRFMQKEDVRVSPDDRGFLFGDGVYEVICSYGGRLFKEHEHMRRLHHSLAEMRITLPDVDDLINVGLELLERNGMQSSYATLYFQITRGAAPRRHAFPDVGTPPTVYVTAAPYELPMDKWNNGVTAILQPDLRWSRCDIKTISLVPNILANQKAMEAGAYEALLVRDGYVTEGTHTSFGAVIEKTLWTHPLTQHLLPGITRSIVLNLCRSEGIPVREEPVAVDRLSEASETILFATTIAVAPLVSLDGKPVGSGKPVPVAKKLLAAFRRLATI